MSDDDDDFGVDYSGYETPNLDGSDAPNTESGDILSTNSAQLEAEPESPELDLYGDIGDAGDSSGIAHTESGDSMVPAYDLGYDSHDFETAGNPNDTDSDGIPSSIDSDEYQSLDEQVYGHYLDQTLEDREAYFDGARAEEFGHLGIELTQEGLEQIGERAVKEGMVRLGADEATGGVAEFVFLADDVADISAYLSEAQDRGQDQSDHAKCYLLQETALSRLADGEDASSVIESLESLDCAEVLGPDSLDFDVLQNCRSNESSLEDVISCYESEVAPTSVDVVSPNGDEANVGLSSFSEEGSQPAMSDPYEFDVETDMGYCGDSISDDFAAASDTGGDSFDGGDDGEY